MCALWLECGELPASSRLGVGHERVPCRVLHATHSMLRGVSRPWRPPSPALDGQRPPYTRTGRPAMLRSAEVGRRRDDRRLRPRSLVSKAALITRGSACQPAGGGGLFCLPAADAALVEEPCNEVLVLRTKKLRPPPPSHPPGARRRQVLRWSATERGWGVKRVYVRVRATVGGRVGRMVGRRGGGRGGGGRAGRGQSGAGAEEGLGAHVHAPQVGGEVPQRAALRSSRPT